MEFKLQRRVAGVRVGWWLAWCRLWVYGVAAADIHWAFRELQSPRLPEHHETGAPRAADGTLLDRYVASRLNRLGLTLETQADRRTLIRRLSFDLRGLPPTPAEVDAFVADSRGDSWERLVESFLASPHYGERWGRHWLDIAAYADSNGYFNADSDRPLAWKYRDYVVRSIQQDKPFDRFIQEQVAGDELVGYVRGGDITPEMIEPLVATGFLRTAPDGTGESDGNPLEVKVDRYTVIEGTVQQLGAAFLGLTLQCARCHEHKFEPIKQEEYYGLQAILRPGLDPEAWLKPAERILTVGTRAERELNEKAIQQYDRDHKTLTEALEGLTAPFRRQWISEGIRNLDEAQRKPVREAWEKAEKERNDAMKALIKSHASLFEPTVAVLAERFPEFGQAHQPLRQSLERLIASKPVPLERIAAFHEPATPPPSHRLLTRGNHATEGPAVEPAVPAALVVRAGSGLRVPEVGAQSTSGRRLALARWLTARENPVVARVLVNRVWNYHFGQGLVPTLENLGRSGAAPSDPELLDWLATEFVSSGWSLKHLHRLILTSATWKQRIRAEVPEVVPGLLAAGPRRLDAESLRDAMLSVSGELDPSQGGAYVPIRLESDGQIVVDESAKGSHRRSLYLQQRRTQPVAMLQVFDGPAHNPVCVQRVPSTVALQSLALLNSEFVRKRSQAFAQRLLQVIHTTSEPLKKPEMEQGIREAFRLAFSRDPLVDELEMASAFIERQQLAYSDSSSRTHSVWTDFCQMLFASNEFLYVD